MFFGGRVIRGERMRRRLLLKIRTNLSRRSRRVIIHIRRLVGSWPGDGICVCVCLSVCQSGWEFWLLASLIDKYKKQAKFLSLSLSSSSHPSAAAYSRMKKPFYIPSFSFFLFSSSFDCQKNHFASFRIIRSSIRDQGWMDGWMK